MTTSQKTLKVPIRISLAVILLGMMANFFEWGYAYEMMLIGFSAVGIFYLIRFKNKPQKKFIDYTKLTLVTFWAINGIFLISNFPYTVFFQIIIAVTFIFWFIMEGTAYFLDEDRKRKNTISQILWNIALVVGTFAIVSGGLLHILKWPYAVHILAIGLLTIVAYILKDLFVTAETQNEDEQNNQEYLL